MKRRKIVPILILILIAAGLVYYFKFYRPRLTESGIMASGHVEVTEVDMSFRLAGHVSRVYVDEGDRVEKGRVLAELDQEILEAQLDKAAAMVREIEARQSSMILAIKIKEEVLEAEIDRAQAGVSAAQARYESLRNGSREEEIREAAAARDRARTEWSNRQRDHIRMKSLYSRQVISARQFEDARTAAFAAKAAYDAAEERFKLVKAGPRLEMISEGQANLQGSDAVLEAARAGRREVDKMRQDLKALEAQGEQARAALAVAEDDLVQSRLYAPFDGFITVKDIEEEEFVQPGTPVVTLARLDQVWVKTYVSETVLGRVRLGQLAEVRTDSYDKIYPGKVTFISPKAEFTPKNIQTREERVKLVYRIKVSLENPGQELKAGMPVDVFLR